VCHCRQQPQCSGSSGSDRGTAGCGPHSAR
jgi:hypothetical protein